MDSHAGYTCPYFCNELTALFIISDKFEFGFIFSNLNESSDFLYLSKMILMNVISSIPKNLNTTIKQRYGRAQV